VAEQRNPAVLAVIAGRIRSRRGPAVRRLGRELHAWLTRYEVAGLEGLAHRSHRPVSCPHRMPASVEAAALELGGSTGRGDRGGIVVSWSATDVLSVKDQPKTLRQPSPEAGQPHRADTYARRGVAVPDAWARGFGWWGQCSGYAARGRHSGPGAPRSLHVRPGGGVRVRLHGPELRGRASTHRRTRQPMTSGRRRSRSCVRDAEGADSDGRHGAEHVVGDQRRADRRPAGHGGWALTWQ
jgi:hypothetical protein